MRIKKWHMMKLNCKWLLVAAFFVLIALPVNAALSVVYLAEAPLLVTGSSTSQTLKIKNIAAATLTIAPPSANAEPSTMVIEELPINEVVTGDVDLKLVGKLFNYPNPFSISKGSTVIGYRLSTDAFLTLKIYTLGGQLIYSKELTPSDYGAAQYHKIPFSSSDLNGFLMSPGTYLYLLVSDGKVLGRNRMVVLP